MALLNSIISGDKPKENKVAFPVIMVHYTKLIPSEKNNYSVEGIKELANMIRLSGGVKQNLLARKKTADEYELIAGHRRRLAVKYLVEELGEECYAMLPVHVEKDGDTLSEINLILTNCGARERNDWEKMMEVERLTELIQIMQTGPVDKQERFKRTFGVEPGINGRELRKVVAKALGLSETKVANLNHINKNLSPALKERFKEGDIGISVANEAAALPAEAQQELNQQEEIRIVDVKQRKSVSESDTETGMEKTGEIEGMNITDFPECLPAEDTILCDTCEHNGECAGKKTHDNGCMGYERRTVSDSDTEEQIGRNVIESLDNAWLALCRQYSKHPDEGIRCGMNLLAKIIGEVRSKVEESYHEESITIEEWITMLSAENENG